MKRNYRLFHGVAFLGALLLAGCIERVIKTEYISIYYQVRTIARSFRYQQHAQLLVKSEKGNFEYLGSLFDPGWAKQSPLGFSGLFPKNIAISSDGLSIVYAHNAFLAGKKSEKEGGLYRHEYGKGEKLLLKPSEFSIAAAQYPKPLPADVNAIGYSNPNQLHIRQAVSANGEIFPLLLLGGNRLHQAAFEGDNEVISNILQERGDSLNALTYWGMTPLEIATIIGKEKTAKYLLLLGAVYKKDEESLLYLASSFKRKLVVDELLKKQAPFDYIAEEGSTSFHATLKSTYNPFYTDQMASDETTIAVLESYLQNGADINMRDGVGRTLLHLTFSPPIVKYLIDSGINVDATDNEGNTALHHAVTMEIDERHKDGWEEKKLPLLELITSKTKRIDLKNNHEASPLQRAIQLNYVRTAEYLIAQGADATVGFIHRGLGPKIPGQSIQKRIEFIKEGEWWRERAD